MQRSLRVRALSGRLEHEADAVADRVLRVPDPAPGLVQRCPGGCPDEEACRSAEADAHGVLQVQGAEAARPTAATEAAIHAGRGGGRPLPGGVRRFFEPRLGAELAAVRVHTDGAAANLARDLGARAFTLGSDVFFGAGEWAPGSARGDRLIAHELSHTLQQRAGGQGDARAIRRQGTGTSSKPAAATPTYSVTTTGCGAAPFTVNAVSTAARVAFDTVRTTSCIRTDALKRNILAQFGGLTVRCGQGTNKPCGTASRYASSTVNIFPDALTARCGPLESTILHEVIHLLEWAPFGHGELADACEKSCFGFGSGDPAKCTYETGFVPVVSGGGGAAFPTGGEPTWMARLYVGLERQSPVLGFVHPSLGIGVGLIGEATTGRPESTPAGTSTLVSVLAGLRLDPGGPGGGNVSLFGGPGIAVGSGRDVGVGGEAGVALGYRWRWLDVSVGAGLAYDPTREADLRGMYTVGTTIKIGPRAR